MDCWPKCLSYIYSDTNLERLRTLCKTEFWSSGVYDMADAVNILGDTSRLYRNASMEMIKTDLRVRNIVLVLRSYHYTVIEEVIDDIIYYYDPITDKIEKTELDIFLNGWDRAGNIYISITQ